MDLKNILTLKYRSTEIHDKIPYRVFPMHRPYYLGTSTIRIDYIAIDCYAEICNFHEPYSTMLTYGSTFGRTKQLLVQKML